MDGKNRISIAIGDLVEVVEKQNQSSGELTQGLVKRILTKSKNSSAWHKGDVGYWRSWKSEKYH